MELAQSRQVRLCHVCGSTVGTYEPAVFVLPHEIVRSSRAASPGLSAKSGCELSHRACFDEHHESVAA